MRKEKILYRIFFERFKLHTEIVHTHSPQDNKLFCDVLMIPR